MHFNHAKLTLEREVALTKLAIESMQPFVLTFVPIYAFLERNQKYVALKAPLDFFSPAELKRYGSFKYFYAPAESVDISKFRTVGRHVSKLLDLIERPDESIPLIPTNYEISDAVIRTIGPIWSQRFVVEPFSLVGFASEVCGAYPPDFLDHARETSVERFECALLRSSLAVFFALHLGYCDRKHIASVRDYVLGGTLEGWGHRSGPLEIDEIWNLVIWSMPDVESVKFSSEKFETSSFKISKKLEARIERIKRDRGPEIAEAAA